MPATATCLTFVTAQMVRSALKAWGDLDRLGRHPLGQMHFLAQRCEDPGIANPIERATLLQYLLRMGIDQMWPSGTEGDAGDPQWRRYLILREQFLQRRAPASVADDICLESSGYYAEQRRALHHLAMVLNGWEIEARRAGLAPSIFLAPAHAPGALLGRADLLDAARRCLIAGEDVALHGLPGSGKSAVAVELAHDPEVLGHFSDGVLWASAVECADVRPVIDEWAEALGLAPAQPTTGLPTRARTVRAAIGLRRMLIVVDGPCSAEVALALRVGGPNCAHLTTLSSGRAAVDVVGANALAVPELNEADGLALLARLAPGVVAAWPEASLRVVRDIGGLPLALTAIGRWLNKEGRSGSRRRIARAFELLADHRERLQLVSTGCTNACHCTLPGANTPAPASLAARLCQAIAPLDPAARRALSALAALAPKPATFLEEEALRECGVAPEALDQLVDLDLLECQGERYAVHPLIADFGRWQSDG